MIDPPEPEPDQGGVPEPHVEPPLGEEDADRAEVTAPGLRFRTARGALVNTVFLLFLELLRFIRRFVIAGLLAVAEYGLFGILAAIAGNLYRLREIGINDKFIQQSESDQERAFQKALTLELIVAGLFSLSMVALAPLMAAGFDEPRLFWLTIVLAAVPPGIALQSTYWVFYRRMDFVRQRTLQAVDPVVSLVVSLGLAVAGAGVWSLVVGLIAGVWTGAVIAVWQSPYPIRPRFDRETARGYFTFSWPVALGVFSGVAIAMSTTIVGYASVGVAGVGAMALANSLIQYATRADDIITGTMFPALCAIQERREVLAETFAKSNRLLMAWAMPIGAGLALFGPELVTGLLGEKWREAGELVRYFGAAAALNQILFNWSTYYRAAGNTRPLAVYGVAVAVAYLVMALPLLGIFGLSGLGIGLVASTVVGNVVKFAYSRSLFPEVRLGGLILRGVLPALVSAAVVLVLRVLTDLGEPVQAGIWLAVLVPLLVRGEWALVREAAGYFRGDGTAPWRIRTSNPA